MIRIEKGYYSTTVRYLSEEITNQEVGRFDLDEKEDRFEIWNLSINDCFRRKGYGTKMLIEFLSVFTSTKPLVLYVYKANEIAIRLYEKVGFSISGSCSFAPNAYTMTLRR